jgi:hypothetical protein
MTGCQVRAFNKEISGQNKTSCNLGRKLLKQALCKLPTREKVIIKHITKAMKHGQMIGKTDETTTSFFA